MQSPPRRTAKDLFLRMADEACDIILHVCVLSISISLSVESDKKLNLLLAI